MSFSLSSAIARGRVTTDPQSVKGGSQRFRHSKGAHPTASGRLAVAVRPRLFGLPARSCEGAPQLFLDHHVSHLLRLLTQAGSLCVSSAFGNGGVVSAVDPPFHTNTSDCPKIASRSSSISHSSSRSSSPAGVVPHSSSTDEEIFADGKIKEPYGLGSFIICLILSKDSELLR